MALRHLRQLYSLDTLDTRFVVPANAPPKEALELDPAQSLPVRNGQVKSRQSVEGVQPSKWHTLEFKTYLVLVGLCVFFMIKAVVDVSKGG
jgi:hypothetical protein